ncbi:MAG: hypothetical protein QOJ70_3641 [Acidobacteriota bacterium]|jgi:hypothetical protein|nr:hypothetical protein [Acidobacteriota bacterium]MDT7809828.1 hypothetical protein [Acidobacteriota bacterium]
MSATTTTPTLKAVTETRAVSLRWIISAREDLVWFIGSVVTSYAMLALYVWGIVPLVPMVVVWAVLVDAPHVFATFSRTYFDREERRTRGRLLWWSLLFFAAGPVAVLAGAGFVFFFVAALWAYYHLVKQHYGFMVLYKKKNGDLDPTDNFLDRTFLLLVFSYPFARFVARDPEALRRVPEALHASLSLLETVLLAATIVAATAWAARQVQRSLAGLALDVPKYLLLAAAVPMHWVVLLTPMPHKPIAIVAMLTIYHNLQYHRLVWFHNQKYKRDEGCRERHGAAEFISRRLPHYIILGVLFGIWYQVPRQYVNHAAAPEALLTQLISGFLWGYALLHYYLDSKIWRVRRDPSVGRALHVE